MGSPFDFLGGLQKGAEQLGSALGNLVSQAPSQPKPSPHAALPTPQPSAPQPKPPPVDYAANWKHAGSDLGSAIVKTAQNGPSPLGIGYNLGKNLLDTSFAKDMGINKLANNFTGTDATDSDTMKGQIATQEQDPNSPLRQLRDTWSGKKRAWEGGPDFIKPLEDLRILEHQGLEGANKWITDQVMTPMQVGANPQFWFADKMDQGYDNILQSTNSLAQDVTGNKGHNYVRDMLNPVVKRITGEDVPPVPSSYEAQSQALVEENGKLQDAANSLNAQSSPEDIAAFNAALEQHNAKSQAQMDAYNKSVNWWSSSPTAKTLSVLGQIAAMPGTFVASAVSFPLSLIADPIGTGEMTTDQVVMGINFVNALQDQDRRDNMTSDELSANISNIVMLGGMMFGAAKVAKGTARGLTDVTHSVLGDRPKKAIIDEINTKLQETDPTLHKPASAPQVDNPPVTLATHSPEEVAAYKDKQTETLNTLREQWHNETDVNKRSVLMKQINDITDERKNMDKVSKPEPQQELPTHGLWSRINELGQEIGKPQEKLPLRLQEQYDSVRDTVRGGGGFSENPRVVQSLSNDDLISLAGEAEARHDMAMLDALDHETQRRGGRDAINGATGLPEGQVRSIPMDTEDFTRPEVQAEAQARRPEDYTTPNAEVPAGPKRELTPDEQMHMKLFEEYQKSGKMEAQRSRVEQDTKERLARFRKEAFDEGYRSEDFPKEEFPAAKVAEGPTTKFEELSPRTIEVMARDAGFDVVPLNEMSGNAWIMRNRKVINIGGAFDPQANHDMFIRAMKLPGDDRPVDANGEHNATKMDMMSAGMVRVSDFSQFLNFGVDRFDPENLPLIEQAIKNDMANGGRLRPYMIDEWATGKHYTIDPQELAAANFNLPDLISNIRTEERAKNGPMYGPANEVPSGPKKADHIYPKTTAQVRENLGLPHPPRSPAMWDRALEIRGWKMKPAKDVGYGLLFPQKRGVQLDTFGGVHKTLQTAVESALDRQLTPQEWQKIKGDYPVVELRNEGGRRSQNLAYFVERHTDTANKIIEDHLLSRPRKPSDEITLESRPGSNGHELDKKFTYEDFKDNNFKLDGLRGRKSFGLATEAPEGAKSLYQRMLEALDAGQIPDEALSTQANRVGLGRGSYGDTVQSLRAALRKHLIEVHGATPKQEGPATEGPWLHDQYRHLRTAEGRVQMLEDRFNDYVAKDVSPQVIRKVQNDLHATYEDVSKQLADLPQGELPAHLAEIRDRLQEKLNEKGYPAITATGAEGATSEAREGLNKTPPGAEGTTLTSVSPGPQGKGQVAFWSPDAESPRTVSARERGRVELAKQLRKEIFEMLDVKGEDTDIRILEALPKNEARREQEITEVIKAKLNDLDPYGYISPEHIVFNPELSTEALLDTGTGVMSINPTRLIPIRWLRGVAGTMQDSMLALKGHVSEEGMVAMHNWFEEIKNMSQAQLDWSGVAEEVLHKYDIDHLSSKGYLEALYRLPWQWWDHARRSGMGDIVEGGISTRLGDGPQFTLKTSEGGPVESWAQAFALARQDGFFGGLDEQSFQATMHAFMEYRVTQLRNYHGIPGTKFTYRVPEVMIREVENPDLISEGAELAGSDFERYVKTETSYGLSRFKAYQEEAAANDASGNAINNAEPTTTLPGSPTAGLPGRDTAHQTRVSNEVPQGPQDWPQVGDVLEYNENSRQSDPAPEPFVPTKEPKWTPYHSVPLRDADDIRRAVNIVNTRGVGPIYTQGKFGQDFRVVGRDGTVRSFKGEMPKEAAQQEAVPTGWPNIRENPESFHNVPTPKIEPVDLSARPIKGNIDQAGFSRKTLRLSQTDPVEGPAIPHAIGKGYSEPARDSEGKPIAKLLQYKPLEALRDTGYPGTWVDFFKAMADTTDSPAYQKARPYWDALEHKYKRAWSEALQEPGVQDTIINAEPSPDAVNPAEMESPAFQARQEKIKKFQAEVAESGPSLEKLAKNVSTKENLTKYAQAKGMVAMKAKYATLDPGIPELEAMQLAKTEYTRVMEEVLSRAGGTAKRERNPQVESMNTSKSLLTQLTPQQRTTIENVVTHKIPGGKAPFKSVEEFINAYAIRDEAAVKLYRTLKGTSRDAVKNVADQLPQQFQPGFRGRLDQTSIPTSMQGAPDHLNPVNPDQFRAVAQSAVQSIVRSGSTEYTERGLEQGQGDQKGLSSLGRLQARNLSRAFRMGRQKIQVVSSNFLHDRETALAIGKVGNGSKAVVDDNLAPWNMGHELTGISKENAAPHLKELMQNTPDYAPPGGESWNQFKARFLPALKEHLVNDKNVIVLSDRNQRLAEAWIANGMPDDLSIDEGYMLAPKSIGPGGILALGNKNDGNYTINNRVSQAPSDAEAMRAPIVPKSNVPLQPEGFNLNMRGRKTTTEQPVKPEPEGVTPQARYNFKIGQQAEAKTANVKGEISPSMPQDVLDRIDAIVADPTIDPTNPLKVAALRAQMERKGVESARAMQVPEQEVQVKVKSLGREVEKAAALMSQKAEEEAKAAPLSAPPRKNPLIWDTSLLKAKDHQRRMMQGDDWVASVSRAAREMLPINSNPLGRMNGILKDGASGLLPPDHMYHSLSPAFKEMFVNPEAVETVKQAKAEQVAEQHGALPFTQAELAGADVPPTVLPHGPEQARKAAAARSRQPKTPQKSSVTPAIADTMRAHHPDPDPPVQESIPDMQKRYNFEFKRAEGMTSKELNNETDQIHEAYNTEYPNPLGDGEENINVEDFPVDVHQAEDQVHDTVAAGASGGGGGRGKTRDLPLEGWDDRRNMASSFEGGAAKAALYADRIVKGLTKLVDASSQYASVQRMTQAHVYARFAQDNMRRQFIEELDKLYPAEMNKDRTFKNPDQQAIHEAMAKAIGGDESERQIALKNLPSDRDRAIAEMINQYHKVLGRLGTRPETHLWDEGQENYFRRQILKDENGNSPMAGGTFSKKMSIAFDRRKRDVNVITENGKVVTRKENYYKDTQALEAAGFKVEKNFVTLLNNHLDQFSNMSITHQLISDFSHLESYAEKQVKRGQTAWVGPLLVKRMTLNPATKKMEPALIAQDYWNQKQVRTVERGPFKTALRDYHVYYKLADVLESLAGRREDTHPVDKIANAAAYANTIYKTTHFAFNPVHAYNLWSDIYAMGTHGLLDPATWNPGLLQQRIFGDIHALLQEKGSWPDWDNTPINGSDFVNRAIGWGATPEREITTSADLGGIHDYLKKYVPGYSTYDKWMWHDLAWTAQLGLIKHSMEVSRKTFESKMGRPMNEAEFNNAGFIATRRAKEAMGFLDKSEMNHGWQVYARALYLAHAWSTSQLRLTFGALPEWVPTAKYMANIGGGDAGNKLVSAKMMSHGGMDQKSLDVLNKQMGVQARRMMIGGATKFLAMSTILSYAGSYYFTGTAQGPWDNAQKDLTRTFDIYGGVDPVTHKDIWYHNPLFGMQQEMMMYPVEGLKALHEGKNPWEAMQAMGSRYLAKEQPILRLATDMATGRNMSLWLKGWGENSAIDKDPQVIAIRRAIDPQAVFPESLENNLIYAIRSAFPFTPGFPGKLDTTFGSNPNETQATTGDILNALGPGKTLGIGDWLNAIQGKPGAGFDTLPGTIGANAAMFLTGSRETQTASVDQQALSNQLGESKATSDARTQALKDIAHAAAAGDYQTVAQITQQFNLSTSQMTSAILHPVAGGGQSVVFKGLPPRSNVEFPRQESLLGHELSTDDTAQLEIIRNANILATIDKVTNTQSFMDRSDTARMADIVAYTNLVKTMTDDQFAQSLGLLGGTPISDEDIAGAVDTAMEFRGVASDALQQSSLYQEADPIERQRMETHYGTFATTLARDAYVGSLKGVPLENIQSIITNTIDNTEAARSYLTNSMFYQLAPLYDQQRMLNEYTSLAETMSKNEALSRGQGSFNYHLTPDQIIPTIQFIINTEETAKSQLHITDFYNGANQVDQGKMDQRYETLARGLAFSNNTADPRQLIANSLNADQSYYDLQTQFGGSNYLKTMADELATVQRNLRTSSNYSPRQIAAIERQIRANFLRANPAYAAWLRAKTNWAKYSRNGQVYSAMNSSEFSAADDMPTTGSNTAAALPYDNPNMNPGSNLGLPRTTYDTYKAQNP